ncbi:hypothetical protein CW751_05370 [Brumimicrobium salinarum]|uniref:Uncharacterized protein n=1 Tax=Brumimicrobium salinarum TaxID=2058658 RepID=A0A2I0R4G4_9FLAO|nr:tetratricopeptide repeat protein [Brumimicrobium salinarum]PKR81482.1 hypothetical protein CW751_05370 [Brumimicrobium salinarum]
MKTLKPFLLLFSCFLTLTINSQEDSIKIVVAKNVAIDSSGIEPAAQKAYNEGTTAFENKDYTSAILKFKQALEISPSFSQARSNLAYTYLANKEVDLAKEQFLALAEADQKADGPYYELGTIAAQKDSFALAVNFFTKAIERKANQADYFYQRGIQYFKLKNYEAAITDFSKVILINPKHADAYNDRGSAYKLSENYKKAIEDYNKAATLNKKSGNAYNNLGSLYREQKKYDRAISAYDKALMIEKDNFMALNNRGFAKFEKGDYKNALGDFKKVILLKPDYTIAYNNIAGVYMEMEEYENVVKYASQAIERDDQIGAAFYNRAIANEMLRNEEQACQDWNRAADLGVRIAEEYYTTNNCGN